MANNELEQKGFVSIENFWGDKIKSIIVMHSADNIEKTEGAVNNISHGEKEENVFQFYYQTHLFPFKNMWKVIVITTDDEVYETDGYFSCSITALDKGVAVVGVNGETKTAYVSFSESGSCSEKLRRVNRHSMFDSQSERYLR